MDLDQDWTACNKAEWDAKVGNNLPPLWGKCKVGDSELMDNGKRTRSC